MSKPLDPTTFASAKLNMLLAVGLDSSLPKLSLRAANVLAGKYMCADNGGEAWAALRTYCADLGISSERALREATYALVAGNYLCAIHVVGKTTRYRIPGRFFPEEKPRPKKSRGHQSTPADGEPGSTDTPAQNTYETPAHHEPDTPAQNTYETPAHHEPTNSGNITPGNELREMNSGKGESGLPPPAKKIRKPSKGTSPSKAESPPEGFEEFWAAYPLHKARGSAERAYAKAVAAGATQQDLLLGAMRYAAERDREPDPATRAKFTAHAATWLNRGSWADEPAPASTLPDSFTNNRRSAPSANSREGFGFRVMRLVEE